MRITKLVAPCLVVLATAVVLAACGGDDSSAGEGDVTCVPLSALRSYRFDARAVQEVQEGQQPLESTPVAPDPFRFVVEVEAETQGENRLKSVVRHGNEDGFQEGETVVVEDTMWQLTGGVWVENEASPLAVPYTAIETCRAIAPDLAISELTGSAEEVHGIATVHYSLNIPNEFFGRHLNVGPSSDLATRIESINVEVWIAEGGDYPVKVEVTGEGEYPDGSRLIAELGYEMYDINADNIDVQPPV